MEEQKTFRNRPQRASLDQNKWVTCLVWGSEGSSNSHVIEIYSSQAITDHAIWGINSFEDLWRLQILPGEDELILRWNDSADSAEALPILRNATIQHGVTEEPLPKRIFDHILKSVLILLGYLGNATVYAIRRYLGKKVNSKWSQKMNRKQNPVSLRNG